MEKQDTVHALQRTRTVSEAKGPPTLVRKTPDLFGAVKALKLLASHEAGRH